MTLIPKAIRIEPAFDDREQIRSMFARHAPYRTFRLLAGRTRWSNAERATSLRKCRSLRGH